MWMVLVVAGAFAAAPPQMVYWSAPVVGTLSRASVEGGDKQVLAELGVHGAVAVDGVRGKVYFERLVRGDAAADDHDEVWRADLDGQNAEAVFVAEGVVDSIAIDVVRRFLFIAAATEDDADSGTLHRFRIDGAPHDADLLSALDPRPASGLAADTASGHLFLTSGSSLLEIDPVQGTSTVLLEGGVPLTYAAVDAEARAVYLVWSDPESPLAPVLARFDLEEEELDILDEDASGVSALALDGARAKLWRAHSNDNGGSLIASDLDGDDARTLIEDAAIQGIALDGLPPALEPAAPDDSTASCAHGGLPFGLMLLALGKRAGRRA